MIYDNIISTVITGKELKKLYPTDHFFIKFMNNNDTHYNMTYKDGFNTDILDFNPNNKCSSGGMYFIDLYNFSRWDRYGDYLRIVSFKNSDNIYIENGKFKCHEFHLSKKILISDFINELNETFQYIIIKQNYKYLRYIDQNSKIKNKIDTFYSNITKFDKRTLKYIKNQTEELCLEAVKNDGMSLEFIKNKTTKIYLEAVKNNGLALQFINEQTYEICLEAVKNNGIILKLVDKQFQIDELCLEAIKSNCFALQYVDNQTYEICKYAVDTDFETCFMIENKNCDLYKECMSKLYKK